MLGFHTGSPRATVDVAVIVAQADIGKAAKALQNAFPDLKVSDLGSNIRFASSGPGVERERIDVVKADNPFFREILSAYSIAVQAGDLEFVVPTAEAAIALKFAAAISPNRGGEEKPQDGADLVQLVRRQRGLDASVLQELGDLVYPGGGAELLSVVKTIRQGRRPVL